MRWFTSDTHFGHDNIRHLSNRPFDSVDEMNEVMIERWNSVVKPNDKVYHLGDVALGTIAESLPLVGRLNGIKLLIPGNHDRVFSGNKQKQIDRFLPEYEKVFHAILPEQVTLNWEGSWKGLWIPACHFPYQGDSHDVDRHADKRPEDKGLPLLHGHVHDAWKASGRMLNVGVDVHDFYPVSEDYINDWLNSLDVDWSRQA